MGSDDTRMLELRQMRAGDERNRLQSSIGQVQQQYSVKTRTLQEVQSKFRSLFDKLKSGSRHEGDGRVKLDRARYNSAALKSANVQIGNYKKELALLENRRKDLSVKAVKVETVRQKCGERILSLKQRISLGQDSSFEQELTEICAVRRRNEASQQFDRNSNSDPNMEPFVSGPLQIGDTGLVQTEAQPAQLTAPHQTQTLSQQQSPFEQVEQIQAWQNGANVSLTLTYRMASGRVINIEASQSKGSVIQVSLAPEFQQDRNQLVRERARMLSALHDAGVRIDGIEIV
jgi:hypothetical protein